MSSSYFLSIRKCEDCISINIYLIGENMFIQIYIYIYMKCQLMPCKIHNFLALFSYLLI